MTSLGSQDIWNHLDSLTKPARSLGRLEELAARLCEVQQTLFPQTMPRRIVLFAGDHGVTASGVSAWPSEVTRLMVKNIRAGGAASTVLARQTQTDAMLIDVGVLAGECADDGDSQAQSAGIRYRSRRIRAGTRDLALEPALLLGEFEAAIHVGRDEAREAASDGMRSRRRGRDGDRQHNPLGLPGDAPGGCPARGSRGPGRGSR